MKTILFTPREVARKHLDSRRPMAFARLLEPDARAGQQEKIAAAFEAIEGRIPPRPVIDLRAKPIRERIAEIDFAVAGIGDFLVNTTHPPTATQLQHIADTLLDIEAVGHHSPNLLRAVAYALQHAPSRVRHALESHLQGYGFTGIKKVYWPSPKFDQIFMSSLLGTMGASALHIHIEQPQFSSLSIGIGTLTLVLAAYHAFKAIRAPLNYRLVAEQPVGQQQLRGEVEYG